jgi:hypothetical protein
MFLLCGSPCHSATVSVFICNDVPVNNPSFKVPKHYSLTEQGNVGHHSPSKSYTGFSDNYVEPDLVTEEQYLHFSCRVNSINVPFKFSNVSAAICGHCSPWLQDIPRNYIFLRKNLWPWLSEAVTTNLLLYYDTDSEAFLTLGCKTHVNYMELMFKRQWKMIAHKLPRLKEFTSVLSTRKIMASHFWDEPTYNANVT